MPESNMKTEKKERNTLMEDQQTKRQTDKTDTDRAKKRESA